MDEIEAFNNLLRRNPTPGDKNIIIRKENVYIVPEWIFQDKSTIIKYKTLKRKCLMDGFTAQILYDIVQLGIVDLNDRPKCPICGKTRKFRNFSEGYVATCTDKSCISELARREVTDLWKNDDYRNNQISTKIEWMNRPEYKQLFRERALKDWKNEEYRRKQVESHIEFCKNNPEKVFAGQRGEIFCNKMNSMMYYDSSWEKDFIKFCDNCKIVSLIERSDLVIPYEFENIIRNYFPDFIITLINGTKLLVEIKSDWLLEKDEKTLLKLEAGKNFILNCDYIEDFIILCENDLYVVGSKPIFKDEDLQNKFRQYIT